MIHVHTCEYSYPPCSSDLPWYKVFYRALDKLAEMKLNHQNEVVRPFLAGLRAHPLPNLAVETVISVVPQGVDTGQVHTHVYIVCTVEPL